MGFEKEELEWVQKLVKKAVDSKPFLGFVRKYRDKTRTHILEVCFNSKGLFIRIMELATN